MLIASFDYGAKTTVSKTFTIGVISVPFREEPVWLIFDKQGRLEKTEPRSPGEVMPPSMYTPAIRLGPNGENIPMTQQEAYSARGFRE